MIGRLDLLADEEIADLLDPDAISVAPEPVAGWRILPEGSAPASFMGGSLRVPLHPDRPTVVANFVETLDGVISFGDPGASGGSAVSGGFGPDRRLMGVLRTMADAVMLGAGTVRRAHDEEWTPRDVDPELAHESERVRREMGLAPQPTTVVVSGSGDLDLGQRGLVSPDVPVVVGTTAAGAERLRAAPESERVRVVALGDRGVSIRGLLDELWRSGQRLVLCEGGPHLVASLLEAGLLDELFLTLAPQAAGRSSEHRRLGLVEGVTFSVGQAPWASLVSVRRAGSHLFLRYRFDQLPKENRP
jgi:riboflavin biosynthesis pyrimidine reductase